jgi:putative DNA primase/helicase
MATFSKALEALEAGGYDGVGIAMLPGAGLVGIDLDNCICNGNGVLKAALQPLVADTYCEISPSGAGLRAFYQGEYGDHKDHQNGVEVFCARKRFFNGHRRHAKPPGHCTDARRCSATAGRHF